MTFSNRNIRAFATFHSHITEIEAVIPHSMFYLELENNERWQNCELLLLNYICSTVNSKCIRYSKESNHNVVLKMSEQVKALEKWIGRLLLLHFRASPNFGFQNVCLWKYTYGSTLTTF